MNDAFGRDVSTPPPPRRSIELPADSFYNPGSTYHIHRAAMAHYVAPLGTAL